jgi:hypothetical protein
MKAFIATGSRESTNQLTGLLASDRESLDKLGRQHFNAMLPLYLEALLQSYKQEFDEALE